MGRFCSPLPPDCHIHGRGKCRQQLRFLTFPGETPWRSGASRPTSNATWEEVLGKRSNAADANIGPSAEVGHPSAKAIVDSKLTSAWRESSRVCCTMMASSDSKTD